MNLPLLLAMFVLFHYEHEVSAFIFLGLVGVSNGLANVLGTSTWAEIYGVKFIGSIKALTTAFMVFSTAFGTAVFGLLIDRGYSIENIALISGIYIIISLGLLIMVRKSLEPIILKIIDLLKLFEYIIIIMARITVEDCLEKVDNQYDLVLLAKERTTQLNAGAKMQVEEDNDKRTIISLREIGDGKVDIKELENSAIQRLRKEPDEVEQQEVGEEIENDEFENLYKGQVSKSGAAVLPSKRTRRIPDNKLEKKEESNLVKEAMSELKAEQPTLTDQTDQQDSNKNDEPLELKEEVEKPE